jgi:CubicO group peptidase (beta-lactamase class C family)
VNHTRPAPIWSGGAERVGWNDAKRKVPAVNLDDDAVRTAARDADFSGLITVDDGDERTYAAAFGLADRAAGSPVTPDTRFAIASGSKIFTALAVLRLVEEGALRLDQPVRTVLGEDLPLIDDAVTLEHLLAHTSGIGDYLDEEEGEIEDYVLTVPVHTLTTAEAFVPVLAGHEQAFAPGERFRYCNAGYVVLALVIERTTGQSFADAVDRLVLQPAGLRRTAYLRSDERPSATAVGYLAADGHRSNVLHLPVVGNGDGGAYTDAADLHAFWRALFAGRIVAIETVERMTAARNADTGEDLHYGIGVWVHPSGRAVAVEGYDAGVSFRSTYLPGADTTVSVFGNTPEGAWPVVGVAAEAIERQLAVADA